MHLTQATDIDLGYIIFTLVEATKRDKSDDFLQTFPWTSTQWYKVDDFELPTIESFYLFWASSAWGEYGKPPRMLQQGTRDFMRIAADVLHPHYSPDINIERLVDILKHRHRYRISNTNHDGTYLILVSQDTTGSPLMILDGNHRAVASMWRAIESGETMHMPKSAWLGLASNMADYYYYQQVLLADQIR